MGLFKIFLFIFTFLSIAGFITTHLWSDGDIIGLVTIIIAIFAIVIIIISENKLNNIQNNTKYIVEDKKYEVGKINNNTICLDGEEYEYSFEYDSNAEIPYAKKIKYQYTKAEKSWFGDDLENYAAIIYTNDMLLIQSHDNK